MILYGKTRQMIFSDQVIDWHLVFDLIISNVRAYSRNDR